MRKGHIWKLGQSLGLVAQPKEKFLYGRMREFPVWIRQIPGKQLLFSTGVKPAEDGILPTREQIRKILPAGIPVVSIKITPFRWQVVLKEGNLLETEVWLKQILEMVYQYLKANDFVPCCSKCGAEGAMPIYQCGQIMRSLCGNCAGETAELAKRDQKRPSKLGKGLLGAIGGTVAGSVVSILMTVLFWILVLFANDVLSKAIMAFSGNTMTADDALFGAGLLLLIPTLSGMLTLTSVCGFWMMLLASEGYGLLGGKLDIKGLIVSGLCSGGVLFVFFSWLFGLFSLTEPTAYEMASSIPIGGVYVNTSALVVVILFCGFFAPGMALAAFLAKDRQESNTRFRRLF